MGRLGSFLDLDWSMRLRFLEAMAALTAVSGGIRLAGFGRTRSLLTQISPNDLTAHVVADDLDRVVSDLAWSVSAAAHHAPFATTCLQRTVTLWWLLRRRGIESDIRIGTTRTNGGMHAHAWLERNGAVLNDDSEVGERFAAFERFR
jgi:hypothetical protein